MSDIKKNLLDIIFPHHCLSCNILLGNECQSYVCRPCLKAIPFTKGFACTFCNSPVKAGKTCVYCAKGHYLDRLLVATSYENPLVEKVLKAIKYRFVRSLAGDMADLMTKYLEKRAGWLITAGTIEIVPVPLHRRRLNWRGFNQAEMVAKKISKSLGWPVITTAMKRVHDPKPQADMPDKQSRIENMLNVFACPPDQDSSRLADKTILLIDDVSTTGSTLNDCARALKGAGAREVVGFVFARSRLDKSSM